MQRRTDALFPAKLSRAALACAVTLAIAACSSSPTQPRVQQPVAKQPARIELQQDPGGFSIFEEVNVDAAVRADYDSAIRLLEQKQYQQGIAMLVKVTQAAPNVTAAHIDLGIAYSRAGSARQLRAGVGFASGISLCTTQSGNSLRFVSGRPQLCRQQLRSVPA
jgi:hypothetical protein